MAKRIGKFLTISVDDSGGTPRAITNDVTAINGIQLVYDEAEIGGYSQDKFYASLRADAPLEINGLFSDTASTGSHTVFSGIVGKNVSPASVTVTIAIGENAAPVSTNPEWEGEYRCTAYTVEFPLDGQATFSATLKPGTSTLPAWGTVA